MYKVLRLIDRLSYQEQHLCEVLTLDGGSDARWRGKKAAPVEVDLTRWSQVSINGSSMDLWFLMDFEEGLWVKQYSIQHNMSDNQNEFFTYPLLVLNDGRILTYIGIKGLLRIYDPRDNTYTDVADIGPRNEIGLYKGSLLSLPNDAS
ncbi:hypothetical protein EJB05_14823, partial [Eragrostis curvula]